MKKTGFLRLLCTISFLLLLAPFYDQCGSHRMKKMDAEGTPTTDSTTVEKIVDDSVDVVIDTLPPVVYEEESIPFYERAYDFIDADNNENAYELAAVTESYFEGDFLKGLKKSIKEEQDKGKDGRPVDVIAHPVKFFSFALIIIITLFMMVVSFTKKIHWLYKLCITNLVLLSITLICIFFFDSFFEKFSQIKWGFYLFIIMQLVVLRLSKKQIELRKV